VFAKGEEEREKLEELSSQEGVDLILGYCTREKRTYVEVRYDFHTSGEKRQGIKGEIKMILGR
jgi:hypothetical protein